MSLKKTGRVGFTYLLLSVGISRVLSLLSQWVLGIYLLPEEFGFIALTSLIFMFTSGFKEAGLFQIIQNTDGADRFVLNNLVASAQWINCIGALGLLISAPLLSLHYGDPKLFIAVVLIALFMPFNLLSIAYKALVAKKFGFQRISKVETISVIASNLLIIGSVFLGIGVYSFLIGQLTLILCHYWFYSNGQQKFRFFSFVEKVIFKGYWRRSKWLVGVSYMNALSTKGDYLVLSSLVTQGALGLYYFSYQLMAAAIQLLGSSLNHLVVPLFSSINDDAERIKRGMVSAAEALSLVVGFLCLQMLVWFPFFINLIWHGKWNDSIILISILTVAVPFRLISSPLSSSIIEALGNYRTRMKLSALDAFSLLAMVAVGGVYGGVLGASFAVMIQRLTFGMCYYLKAISDIGYTYTQGFFIFLKLMFPYGFSLLFLYIAHPQFFSPVMVVGLGLPKLLEVSFFIGSFFLLLSATKIKKLLKKGNGQEYD